MESDKLIAYLLEGREHNVEPVLRYWVEKSKRYFDFVYHYRDKIRSKFRNAITEDDLEDIRFELELPCLFLLDDKYIVEYEKFGNGRKRAPDFTVQLVGGFEFNVEVKRIREGRLGVRYEKVIEKIIKSIEIIPSSLAFTIDVLRFDSNEDFIASLENSTEQVVDQIRTLISTEELKMPYDSCTERPLLGFKDEIVVTLSRPSGKTDSSRTSYHGGLDPIFFTDKEFRKLGDIIFEKLGQCIPGMINVLFVSTNSTTHEPEDVPESIMSINKLIRKKDSHFFKNKGFDGVDEFMSASRNLSGIVFKTIWVSLKRNHNLVWCNRNSRQQIPQGLKDYMTYMGKM